MVTLSVCPTPPVPHFTVGWWVTRVVSGHPLCVPHTPSPSPHCGVVGHQGGQWSPSLCAPHPQSLTSECGVVGHQGGQWSPYVCPTPPVPHLTVGWWVTRVVSGHPLWVPHGSHPTAVWGRGSPGWSVVTLSVPHTPSPSPQCGVVGHPLCLPHGPQAHTPPQCGVVGHQGRDPLSVPTPPVRHLNVVRPGCLPPAGVSTLSLSTPHCPPQQMAGSPHYGLAT